MDPNGGGGGGGNAPDDFRFKTSPYFPYNNAAFAVAPMPTATTPAGMGHDRNNGNHDVLPSRPPPDASSYGMTAAAPPHQNIPHVGGMGVPGGGGGMIASGLYGSYNANAFAMAQPQMAMMTQPMMMQQGHQQTVLPMSSLYGANPGAPMPPLGSNPPVARKPEAHAQRPTDANALSALYGGTATAAPLPPPHVTRTAMTTDDSKPKAATASIGARKPNAATSAKLKALANKQGKKAALSSLYGGNKNGGTAAAAATAGVPPVNHPVAMMAMNSEPIVDANARKPGVAAARSAAVAKPGTSVAGVSGVSHNQNAAGVLPSKQPALPTAPKSVATSTTGNIPANKNAHHMMGTEQQPPPKFNPRRVAYMVSDGVRRGGDSSSTALDAESAQSRRGHHPDLPFLVTHWVSQYAATSSQPTPSSQSSTAIVSVGRDGNKDPVQREKEEALRRIQHAASELASAFQTLGAFGDASQIAAGLSSSFGLRPTSYADLSRKYAPLLSVPTGNKSVVENPSRMALLDALIGNTSSSHEVAAKKALKGIMPWSLLEAAWEGSVPTSLSTDPSDKEGEERMAANAVLQNGKALSPGRKRPPNSPQKRGSPVRGRRIADSLPSVGVDEANVDSLVPSGQLSGSAMRIIASQGMNPVNGSVKNSSLPVAAQASRRRHTLRMEAMMKRRELESTMQALKSASMGATPSIISPGESKTSVDLLQRFHSEVPVQEVGGGSLGANAGASVTGGVAAGAAGSVAPGAGPVAGAGANTAAAAVAGTTFGMGNQRAVDMLHRRMNELQYQYSVAKGRVKEEKRKSEQAHADVGSIRKEGQDSYAIIDDQSSTLHQIYRAGSGQRNLGFGALSHSSGKNKIVQDAILMRQYRGRFQPSSYSHTNLSVLKSRLAHAVTISSHLVYPVYCLRFDKTGKYFITGADDQVVKVFHLGAGNHGVSNKTNNLVDLVDHGAESGLPLFNYGANERGAVLVCSLRGHAGVVADIDVSSDNSLLATASIDGDVRVWGLQDGRPVAILRGHKDGANMVSWSTLSPFRLATCGEDGLARVWDVREAALDRYGEFIGGRSYCKGPKLATGIEHAGNGGGEDHEMANDSIGMNNNQNGIEIEGNHGDFVANNRIDKGVILIAELQHGQVFESNGSPGPQGRVTRANDKAIKVMCIARCPIGGHFATGTDKGWGFVWADDDDWNVERLDRELSEFDSEDDFTLSTPNPRSPASKTNAMSTPPRKMNQQLVSPGAPSNERLLATLRGHNNAVTDMKYSSAGDRILTASMKDGLVIIWSWGKEGSTVSDHGATHAKLPNVTHFRIQLVPASRSASNTAHTSKQKPTAFAASSQGGAFVHCDGVTWTCDDMKIVTSQSSRTKAVGNEIIPGSHMIYVWDSRTGKCLLGIMASHESLCSALAPHPTLPTVVASAGSDGVVNVWDLDRGDCFCTHTNSLLHGPAELATNRGKRCGYLEVQFSPDGLDLVLTDENGRVTILDTLVPANTKKPYFIASRPNVPAWMGEQYFANDYYDLIYDANGYCIERGSEQPPHLAPEGVRCTHEGLPHSENIMNIFRNLEGPLPLPENSLRWYRDDIRARSIQVRLEGGVVCRNERRKGLVQSPEFVVGCVSTAIITKDGKFVQHERKKSSPTKSSSRASGRASGRSSGSAAGNQNQNDSTSNERELSSRYRWIGYEDAPESEHDDEDQDDEEYQAGNSLSRSNLDADEEEDNEDEASPHIQRRRRRPGSMQGRRLGRGRVRDRSDSSQEVEEQQPSRASSRQTAQRTYQELDSDDEQLNELMSTHTHPSGNFCEDWTESKHLFKMPRDEGSLAHREWLSRVSRQDNCLQKRFYCPQVGDSVVYCPRAHQDTLARYPICGYLQPWKAWPTNSSWPVVRCQVTHVRYRFPYETHYRSRKKSEKLQGVAAILSLEISGVPSESCEHNFPWPAATFVSPAASRTRAQHSLKFEVTLFQCNEADFIIPECLYSWRIKELERAIAANGGTVDGLSVSVNCPADDECQDSELDEYAGKLSSIVESNEDELHFLESGYNSIILKWDLDDDDDGEDTDEFATFSPWDINVKDPSSNAPTVPTMTEKVKRAVTNALKTVRKMDPKIKDLFHDHVDVNQYTDYLEMIEVPMYISFIEERLQGNYYTNKLSVVADMETLKENCYKYNEDGNGYYALACRMYDKFKSLVDDIEEPDVPVVEEQRQTRSKRKSAAEISQAQPHVHFATLNSESSSDDSSAGSNEHDNLEAMDEARTGISDEVDEEDSHGGDGHGEDESKVISESQSAKESPEAEATQRQTRRSNLQSQSTEARNSSTRIRISTRAVGKASSEPSSEGKGTAKSENQGAVKRQTRHSAQQSESKEDESPSRRMPTRAMGKSSIKSEDEEESDDQSESEDEEESDDQSEHQGAARRQTRQFGTQLQPPEAENPSRRVSARPKGKTSYVEKDSDEEEYLDSDEDDGSDDEDKNINSDEDDGSDSEVSYEETSRKRKRGPSSNGRQPRKRGRGQPKEDFYYFPELPRWPPVSRRKMLRVGPAILKRLRELDTLNLFSRPVLEDFPNITDEYLNAIETPMDFRTIEEERLPEYKHIVEMQEDLERTFKNCCRYNGEKHECSVHALKLWRGLNDIFEDVC